MPFYKYRPLKQWGRHNTRLFKKKFFAELLKPQFPFIESAFIKEQNIVVEDPNHPDFPQKVTPYSHFKERFMFDPSLEHATQSTEPHNSFLYNGSEPFAEGVIQALVLSKAVRRGGIPEEWLAESRNLFSKLPVPLDLETRLKELIMHSQQFDSHYEKLPPRFNKELPQWRYKPYYGTPLARRSEVLLDKMFHLCFSSMALLGDLPVSVDIARNEHFASTFSRNDDMICIEQSPQLAFLCPNPVPALANAEKVAQSSELELDDIYPIKAVIDLQKHFIDGLDPNSLGSLSKVAHSCVSNDLRVHTVLINKPYDVRSPWKDEENMASLIMDAFGVAVAQKSKMDPDASYPVVVQAIQCCRNKLDFCIFQLNTTELVTDGGVKNMVWLDMGNQMFDVPEFFENMETVDNLDADVFYKVLSFLRRGFI